MLGALVACGGDDIYRDPSAATNNGEGEGTGEDGGSTDNGNTDGGNGGGIGENNDTAPGDNYATVRPA